MYKTLMNYCNIYGIGWIAWSWSGNGGIDLCLDITSPNTFSRNDLTEWGRYIFYGNGGIQETSKKAYITNIYCENCEVTAYGTDGSEWGYENGRSCRINSEKCNTKEEEASGINGFPYCESCVITATSEDGVRWGWENNQSCIINDSKC